MLQKLTGPTHSSALAAGAAARPREAGAATADVIRTVVYLRDVNDAEAVAKAHLEMFDKVRPASTLIQVTSMLRPWQKVEIEAYASIASLKDAK